MVSCLLILALAAGPKEITLTPSQLIRTDAKVKPGVYTLADKGDGAIRVDADGVTVDFQGATLESPDAEGGKLETFNGVGLAVNGHKNVTIRNAVIHGYQYNLKAMNCPGLKLVNCELGQSRSQKILDGDTVNYIWLVLRGLDVWRQYGSGAWLEGCNNATVKRVKANQCQNGLIMVECNNGTVLDCDVGYTSGWGIALWKSSDNLICWNHVDFVNRPWGGSWGGDSSGVVMTTGCNRNVWAYNSFTHGGDGFFLATLDGGIDGEGKLHENGTCDDNEMLFNDGSYSTANAFESTFSSGNVFYKNWCNDSNYGFWLGYSKRNLLLANEIIGSQADGIAHEQGPVNWFVDNDIENTKHTAIHLWSGTDARFAQSPSKDNVMVGNRIIKAAKAFDLSNSTNYFADENVIKEAPIPDNFVSAAAPAEPVPAYAPRRLKEIMSLKPAGFKLYRDTDRPKGWQWLSPSTYGMRDYRDMIVPWMMRDHKTLRLLLYPSAVEELNLPDWMVMTDGPGKNEKLITSKPSTEKVGEYRDFKIKVTGKSGKRQTMEGRILDLEWKVRWFKWFRNEADAYTDTEAWKKLFAGPALKEETLPDLPAIPWYAPPEPGLPSGYFALVATAKVKLDAGEYRFDSISDDGLQVFVDRKAVIDNWTHHGPTTDTGKVRLSSGIHDFEVHYCQETGAAALSVHWTRMP